MGGDTLKLCLKSKPNPKLGAEEARKTRIREGLDNEAPADTSFRAFVKDTFLPWVETNLARGTYQSYKWRCDYLIEAFGAFDLSEISAFGIEKFKREQLKRKTKRGDHQAPASVNRYLQILASIFTRADHQGTRRPRRHINHDAICSSS